MTQLKTNRADPQQYEGFGTLVMSMSHSNASCKHDILSWRQFFLLGKLALLKREAGNLSCGGYVTGRLHMTLSL